jgi:hypothetical protein
MVSIGRYVCIFKERKLKFLGQFENALKIKMILSSVGIG